MQESARFGGIGMIVWAGVSINGRNNIHINRNRSLAVQRYRDEILIYFLVSYSRMIGDNFILIDDNFRPHRTGLLDNFFYAQGIIQMVWPASTMNMSPIEIV